MTFVIAWYIEAVLVFLLFSFHTIKVKGMHINVVLDPIYFNNFVFIKMTKQTKQAWNNMRESDWIFHFWLNYRNVFTIWDGQCCISIVLIICLFSVFENVLRGLGNMVSTKIVWGGFCCWMSFPFTGTRLQMCVLVGFNRI